MKKYSVAVCVCAVLFSVGIHGGGMREVFARAPGADENLVILQDIIRENECQAGMAFLGYTYEGAEAAEILEYTRQEELAAAYPFLQDGTVVDVVIGEDENDPVVGISDLLIHLSADQLDKKAAKVIEGENLDVTLGNMPLFGEEKDAVKANVLKLLKEKYDIEEEDFVSAEIEVVPSGKARDYGLDRSMVAGYGHDDRVCSDHDGRDRSDHDRGDRGHNGRDRDHDGHGDRGHNGRDRDHDLHDLQTGSQSQHPLSVHD